MAQKYSYQRDRDEIDRQFYTLYDPQFLMSKAATLMAALFDREGTKERMEQLDLAGIGAYVSDEYFAALTAELHFTELHEFESLVALLIAPFQALPHWIYLTVYETSEIQSAVDRLVRDEIAAVTGSSQSDHREFIAAAIYNGYVGPSDGPPGVAESWIQTFDNAFFLIQLMGERYLRGKDTYNAYKHGLRVTSGARPSSFTATLESPTGERSAGFPIRIEHSLIELQKEKFQDGWRFHEVVRSFDPNASFFFLSAMHQMLVSMQRSRLARLRGENAIDGLAQFRKLDRPKAQHLAGTDGTGWRVDL